MDFKSAHMEVVTLFMIKNKPGFIKEFSSVIECKMVLCFLD